MIQYLTNLQVTMIFSLPPAVLAILAYNALWGTVLPMVQSLGVWFGFAALFYTTTWLKAVRS